jgi:hypothetical protein
MKWPRGKYNGRRIVGFNVKVELDVTEWRWMPVIGHHCGMLHWLCFRSWWQATYESRWRANERGDE